MVSAGQLPAGSSALSVGQAEERDRAARCRPCLRQPCKSEVIYVVFMWSPKQPSPKLQPTAAYSLEGLAGGEAATFVCPGWCRDPPHVSPLQHGAPRSELALLTGPAAALSAPTALPGLSTPRRSAVDASGLIFGTVILVSL